MVILDRAVCAFPTFGPSGTGQVRLSGPVHIATIGKSDAEFRNFVCDAHTHTLYKWVNFRPKQFGCRIGYMQALQRWHRLHTDPHIHAPAARPACCITHDVWTHHPHEAPIALFYFYSTLVRRGSSAEQCVYLANSIYPRPFHRRPGVASRDPLAIFTSSSSPAAACQFADYYRITLILFSSLSLFRFIPLSPPASPAFPLYAENARRQQRQ